MIKLNGYKKYDTQRKKLDIKKTYCTISFLKLQEIAGTSLVVQWLRLHDPKTGDSGSIPGQGTRSDMPQLKKPTGHN